MEKFVLFGSQSPRSSAVATPRRRGAAVLKAAVLAGLLILPGCAPHTPPIRTFSQADGVHAQLVSFPELGPSTVLHAPNLAVSGLIFPAEEVSTPVAAPGPVLEAAAPAPAPVAISARVKAKMPASALQYVPIIEAASMKYGVPANILTAALSRESANFRERYIRGYHVDGTGRGMAGIDKMYHPEVSDEQAFDPSYAIFWMAEELSDLTKKHDGNVYSALREYNGGPNFASSRIGYGGSTVGDLTQRHADAIFAYAEGVA